ncbi:hypothetical protein [Bradyrhizobium sp. WD16]|uniref:hypothetical protein n=1 Tax=Bradyrhizobium sp. WD16 TaxID=1521768 RepID=UPI0020A50C94|nr:hypothetical protein [Bradyrhizobium sp. WD16]
MTTFITVSVLQYRIFLLFYDKIWPDCDVLLMLRVSIAGRERTRKTDRSVGQSFDCQRQMLRTKPSRDAADAPAMGGSLATSSSRW